MNRMRTSILLLGLAPAVLLGACGDDDGAGVREIGADETSSGASGSGSGSASGTAECTPVGTELAADATETVEIALKDYEFAPAAVEVAAGTVTFSATNEGDEDHELAVLPGGGPVPFTPDGAPDEDALTAAGAFELEAFPPGETCEATWELDAGTYTLFCIVEAADGETHAEKGMVGELTVS